jgi:putative ABC transport system ATP-binding protein
MSKLIELTNISKQYTLGEITTTVLNRINLTVETGELLAIIGASGSGKSTLMNIIGLLDKPSEGDYRLNHQDTRHLSDDELALRRNQHIGFVFQQFHLLPRLNAFDNVALPLTYRGCSKQEIALKVNEALSRVSMQRFAKHRPTELSGGQQQRVAIARALVGEPQLILADEPTGALDSKTSEEVMSLFLALHEEGRTLLMITHDAHIAGQCKRQITLADGSIIQERLS